MTNRIQPGTHKSKQQKLLANERALNGFKDLKGRGSGGERMGEMKKDIYLQVSMSICHTYPCC